MTRAFVKKTWTTAGLLLAIFAIALTFRLVMLDVYRPTSPWVAALTLADAEMGRNLVEGRGWRANAQMLERATTAQVGQPVMVDLQDLLPVDDSNPANIVDLGMAHSPGYSTWFALSYRLGGEYRYIYSQRMQALLDALAALLVFAIGSRCWSRAAGVVGGLVYALSPPHAFLGNLTVAAATDSFWFLLTAFGAVVTAGAITAGRRPWAGCALVAAGAFGGACMNSTALVLPTIAALMALALAVFDRRQLRVAATLFLAQLIVLAALTPWAFRNQRQFDQFTLVRGSFWQLAFAAWGELPNPWGLGFDDKEYWHWIDENCPGCSPGAQQDAMRRFLLAEVVPTRPFPRHLSNLLSLRLPRAVDVARTPEGAFRADAPKQRVAVISVVMTNWNRAVPFAAMLAAIGLLVALMQPDRRLAVVLGLAPTIFLSCFSLLFYVELRKTVPGYGYLFVLVGIAATGALQWIKETVRRLGRPQPALTAMALLVLAGSSARLHSQAATIAAGGELHSEIVTFTGEVLGWGNDLYGQLGDGERFGRYAVNRKAQALGMRNALSVAAGSNHSLVLQRDGSVWGWGDNSMGQLGDGTRAPHPQPIRIAKLAAIRALSGGYAHSLALGAEGAVWAWGSNLYGQLGTNRRADALEPVRVAVPRKVVAIAAGWFFSLAVDDSGRVWAWGRNSRGQLGLGSTHDVIAPTPIPGLADIQTVAAGHQHALALGRDGRVWGWGANDYGQVGVARSDGVSLFPRAFDLLDAVRENVGRGKRAERSPIVPVNNDGRTERAPRQVSGVPVPQILVAAADSTLAITRDGSVWAWGDNLYGQLADGTFITRSEPRPATSLPPVTVVAAGHSHFIALAKDWTVWTWGFGHYGQLGDGLTDRRLAVPRKIQNLRAREPELDLSHDNALVFGPAQIAWKEQGVVADSRRLLIKGNAANRYTYAALSRPMPVGPDTSLRHLYVQGSIRSGGITVGVQEKEKWVFQANVDLPGPFTVFWDVPAPMEATVVIAHYLPGESLASDIEVASWGWLKTLPTAR